MVILAESISVLLLFSCTLSPCNFKANSVFHQISMCFTKESNCFAAVSQRNERYKSRDLWEVRKQVTFRKPRFHWAWCSIQCHLFVITILMFKAFLIFNKMTADWFHQWVESRVHIVFTALLSRNCIVPYHWKWGVPVIPSLWIGTETRLLASWIPVSKITVWSSTAFPFFVCFHSSWTSNSDFLVSLSYSTEVLCSSVSTQGRFVLLGIRNKWFANPNYYGEESIFLSD